MLKKLLQEHNPKIHPSQWYYYPDDGCSFKDKLDYDPEKYIHSTSLIYYDSNHHNPMVIFENGKPSYVLKWKVYFLVCRDMQYLDPKEVPWYSYHESVEPYLHLFSCDPNELSFMKCNGAKCRRNISQKTGVWCKSCHGDIKGASFLSYLFRENLHFNDLYDKSILHMEFKKENITQDPIVQEAINIKLQQDLYLASQIKQRLNNYDRYIEEYIQSINKKRQEDIEVLNKLDKRI